MAAKILLLGGHGRISLLLTDLMLSRSWNVTSVVRNPDQTEAILAKGHGRPGKINVLVRSLEDVRSEDAAQSIINEVMPNWVVWAAGKINLPYVPAAAEEASSSSTRLSRAFPLVC